MSVIARLERRLANPYTGIVTAWGPIPVRPHDPDVPMWAATVAPEGPRHEAIQVGGCGWTPEHAAMACAGEAIERHAAWALPSDGLVRAAARELPDAAPVDAWALYHDDQYALDGFGFEPLTRDLELSWCAFRTLHDGRRMWVPEELAFLYPTSGMHRLGASISTGYAAGRQGDPVILRGLQEVVERDAMAGAWLCAYSLEEVPADAVFERLSHVADRVRRPNLTYRCYRFGSPFTDNAVMVTVTGDDLEGWCFAAGTAVRETLAAAFEKALLEALQGRVYVRWLRAQRPPPSPEAPPRTFAEHVSYYTHHRRRLRETILARAPLISPDFDRPPETPDGLVARLRAAGRTPLARIMTPPSDIDAGWTVVRVLVPGLQPLHSDHTRPFLGGAAWGDRPVSAWATIPPHPFA